MSELKVTVTDSFEHRCARPLMVRAWSVCLETLGSKGITTNWWNACTGYCF